MSTPGHPAQDAVAAQRSPADAWRGIVALVKQGHSPIDVSGISRSKAVLEVDALLHDIADCEPISRFTCDYCGCYSLDAPFKHAPSCAWQRARELTNKETK